MINNFEKSINIRYSGLPIIGTPPERPSWFVRCFCFLSFIRRFWNENFWGLKVYSIKILDYSNQLQYLKWPGFEVHGRDSNSWPFSPKNNSSNHSTNLEPDLDLSLRESQVSRELPALLLADVGAVEELLFQLNCLIFGVGLPLLTQRMIGSPIEGGAICKYRFFILYF